MCCKSGLQMIDDELNGGQSSPPPPAPNGENSSSTEIFQPTIINQQQQQQQLQQLQQAHQQQKQLIQSASWNPFCTPSLQQQDSHRQQQLSSMNPFAADLMKQQVFEHRTSNGIFFYAMHSFPSLLCTHNIRSNVNASQARGKEFCSLLFRRTI